MSFLTLLVLDFNFCTENSMKKSDRFGQEQESGEDNLEHFVTWIHFCIGFNV